MPQPSDRQPAPPGLPARWVLLRHTLADGSWHHDWMLERSRPAAHAHAHAHADADADAHGGPPVDPDDRRMLTFRTQAIPGKDRHWTAERIHDHRAHYLTYEGPLTGGRGRVDRVASGELQWLDVAEDRLRLRLLGPGGGRVIGEDLGTHWHFALESDA